MSIIRCLTACPECECGLSDAFNAFVESACIVNGLDDLARRGRGWIEAWFLGGDSLLNWAEAQQVKKALRCKREGHQVEVVG
jgi:hypothetical protein